MPGGVLINEQVLGCGQQAYTPLYSNAQVTGGWIAGDTEAVQLPGGDYAQCGITGDPFGPYSGTRVYLCNHPVFSTVEELTDDVDGTPFDSNGVRTYVRRFRVTCKINYIGPAGVCQCPGIPKPYAPYIPFRTVERDLQAKVVRISARREVQGDWQNWIVTVNYSTEMPAGGRPAGVTELGSFFNGTQNNPWDEPPYIRLETEDTQAVPDVDRDGLAYLNSATQPFTPPFSLPDGLTGMVIRRNERLPTLEAAVNRVEQFNYAVNSVVYLGRPVGAVLSKVESAEEVYRGDLRYWVFVYRLRFKKKELLPNGQDLWTWQPRILDAGLYRFRKVLGIPLKDQPIVPITRGGLPISYPVPLDGNGGVAVADANGKITPVYIRRKHYREEDFNPLTLPTGKL